MLATLTGQAAVHITRVRSHVHVRGVSLSSAQAAFVSEPGAMHYLLMLLYELKVRTPRVSQATRAPWHADVDQFDSQEAATTR